MKKLKFILFLTPFLLIILVTSCSDRNELYRITDGLVESLSTNKESYGVFESGSDKKITSDNKYQVMPTGRLIVVKYINYADEKEYEKLKDDITEHYSGDNMRIIRQNKT